MSNISSIRRDFFGEALFGGKGIVCALVVMAFFPFFISLPVATEIMIYSLFALAFNLLLGYTGMISFGHALYFGLGAYAAGMSLRYLSFGVGSSLIAAMLVGTISAGLVGVFSIKKRGIYFAMISMAFAQLAYFMVMTPLAKWTGGDDGLSGIPELKINAIISIDLTNDMVLYYFIYGIIFISVMLLYRIVNSPFGYVLQSVRENEERISACGYDVIKIKFLSLLFSGCFSSLAGALYTIYLGYVPVTTLFWLVSGTILMMTLLGGTKVFIGPIIGVFAFLLLENKIELYTDRWQFFVGGLFVVIVMLFPDGIMGTLRKRLLRQQAASLSAGGENSDAS